MYASYKRKLYGACGGLGCRTDWQVSSTSTLESTALIRVRADERLKCPLTVAHLCPSSTSALHTSTATIDATLEALRWCDTYQKSWSRWRDLPAFARVTIR